MRITETALIDRFAKAIARKEGFFDKKKIPSVARRLNNPGCLRHWKDRAGKPYPMVNGYVEFPTIEAGWRALRAQCKINVLKRKLTFREFFAGRRGVYAGFAPKDGSSPVAYARDVLCMMAADITIDTPIVALLGAGDGKA